MRILISFLAFTLSACATGVQPAAADELLLVGNKGEDTVSVIDLASGTEVARIPTSHTAPHEIVPSPTGWRAAVVNYGDNAVDIIDIASRAVVETIDLGEHSRPHGIAWLGTDDIIVTTEGNGTVVRLRPATCEFGQDGIMSWTHSCTDFAVEGFPTGADGSHMLAMNGTDTVFTADMQSGTVTKLDLRTGNRFSAPAGEQPEGIALTSLRSPNAHEVWVSARGSDEVIVFDTALEELARIPVGRFPLRLLISPDGRHAVTSNLQDASVSVIDVPTRKLVRTIAVGEDASTQQVTLLFSDDGSRLYVAETGTDTVAEMDFASGVVLRRIAVGRQGDGLAIVSGP